MIDHLDDAALERALAGVARVSPADARALATDGRAVLVDIRDSSAYENAHIAGAVSLPLAVLDAAGGEVPPALAPPRDRLVVLYCA
jgi:rhodanese-related sulfurtransferase